MTITYKDKEYKVLGDRYIMVDGNSLDIYDLPPEWDDTEIEGTDLHSIKLIQTKEQIDKFINKRVEDAKTLEDLLAEVDYLAMNGYIPSNFAVTYINFINAVNGGSEENTSPPMHYHMIDNCLNNSTSRMSLNGVFRGSGKTSLFMEYLIFYLAVYRELPFLKDIDSMVFVTDSESNGVKAMRKNLEDRYNESTLLQQLIPTVKWSDTEWTLINADGQEFVGIGVGIKQGVRGGKRHGKRPKLVVFDDIFKDSDAESEIVSAHVANVMNKAVKYMLHPKEYLIIWNNTVYNVDDLVYKAIQSGAWNVNVYPVCQKFPCDRNEFVGAWEDRFGYDEVVQLYIDAKLSPIGDEGFFQEMMLDIIKASSFLVDIDDIVWYDRRHVLENKHLYNFYCTTDFATTDNTTSDYSVILIWAYSNNGDWILVDGSIGQQLIDVSINQLFRFYIDYKFITAGIEISGQQGAIVTMIERDMMQRNIYFDIYGNGKRKGIQPTSNKLARFALVAPRFRNKKFWFPKDLRYGELLEEGLSELKKVTKKALPKPHDDFLDCVSMTVELDAFGLGSDVDINQLQTRDGRQTVRDAILNNGGYNDMNEIFGKHNGDVDNSVSSYFP